MENTKTMGTLLKSYIICDKQDIVREYYVNDFSFPTLSVYFLICKYLSDPKLFLQLMIFWVTSKFDTLHFF